MISSCSKEPFFYDNMHYWSFWALDVTILAVSFGSLAVPRVTTISAVDPDLDCFTDAPDYLKHVDKSQLRIVDIKTEIWRLKFDLVRLKVDNIRPEMKSDQENQIFMSAGPSRTTEDGKGFLGVPPLP
ncbi:hypothetical protein E3N88_07779 [Mikania micrantha]|uniref:Uncharacterized protein n=1 Tax=Mikania micrantha TaxID=192012 RepID=A0A5N6PEG1_9ASTR|nr:hypothetical protein E3N88_07779 [Mikania micrantha]